MQLLQTYLMTLIISKMFKQYLKKKSLDFLSKLILVLVLDLENLQ